MPSEIQNINVIYLGLYECILRTKDTTKKYSIFKKGKRRKPHYTCWIVFKISRLNRLTENRKVQLFVVFFLNWYKRIFFSIQMQACRVVICKPLTWNGMCFRWYLNELIRCNFRHRLGPFSSIPSSNRKYI